MVKYLQHFHEQVAEQLMIMHEDCLKGNYESIEKLRKLGLGTSAVSQSRQVTYFWPLFSFLRQYTYRELFLIGQILHDFSDAWDGKATIACYLKLRQYQQFSRVISVYILEEGEKHYQDQGVLGS